MGSCKYFNALMKLLFHLKFPNIKIGMILDRDKMINEGKNFLQLAKPVTFSYHL